MTEGYTYCFSNLSMPGIVKVGMTERTPEERLCEANASDTWRPPTPYVIEFAKKVTNVSEKEKTLHILLEQYTERIHPRREFFRVSPEEVRKFFELMDGEMWVEEDEDEDEDEDEKKVKVGRRKIACHSMKDCFVDGQGIRHKIGINKIWTGMYDSSRDGIICDGTFYTSLSALAKAHLGRKANGWYECECEVDGKWISTYKLPKLLETI